MEAAEKDNVVELPVGVKKKRGRPSKALVEAAKKPGQGKVGRPVGTAGRINELKARLLSTTGDRVIETIIRKALNDGDPDQIACLKMCMDRILPVSLFEKSAGRPPSVQIQIVNTSDTVTTIGTGDAVDIDFEEIEDDDTQS
jgi:hypothetical protein